MPVVDFFTAEPASVAVGQALSLKWSVRGATRVQIDNNVGEVELSGSRPIQPNATTTYKLEASNAAGTATKVVTIQVGAPPAQAETTQRQGNPVSAEVLATQLQDIHFGYNTEEILENEKPIVEQDTAILRNLFAVDEGAVVMIEGHCDERGSSEYNLGLGDRRAKSIKDIFVRAGLPENRLNAVSYGKEQPNCLDATEDCFARNRRVHFSPAK